MHVSRFLAYVIIGIAGLASVLAQKRECDREKYIQCLDQFARKLGYPDRPGTYDIPDDGKVFVADVAKFIANSNVGFGQYCGFAVELFACLGPDIDVCLISDFWIGTLHFTPESAAVYETHIQQTIPQCLAVLEAQTSFSCISLNDGHYPHPNLPCSKQFYVCVKHTAMIGLCPENQTINLITHKCEFTNTSSRCKGLPWEPTPKWNEPSFTCPLPDGKFGHPMIPCSFFYYQCSNAAPKYTMCDSGLYFDVSSGDCIDRSMVDECTAIEKIALSKAQCNAGLLIQCLLPMGQKLNALGVLDVLEVPKDATSYLNGVQKYIKTAGPDGFIELCGISQDFIECVGPQLDACLDPDFLKNTFQVPHEAAHSYRVYLTKGMTACMSMFMGHVQFTCKGRDEGLHWSPSYPCGPQFFQCKKGAMIAGSCHENETINLVSNLCEPVAASIRCIGKEIVSAPSLSQVKKFTCPHPGKFAPSVITCSRFYYWCTAGAPKVVFCEPGKYFDPIAVDCVDMGTVPACTDVKKFNMDSFLLGPEENGNATHCAQKKFMRCVDTLARNLGYPDIPDTTDLPRNATQFVQDTQRLIDASGPDGLVKLCGYAQDFFECAGEMVGSCLKTDFLEPTLGVPQESSRIYRQYLVRAQIECLTLINGMPSFTCDGRKDGLHLSPEKPCDPGFWFCQDGEPIPAECPAEMTINLDSATCEATSLSARCTENAVEVESNVEVTFTCPQPFGNFSRPIHDCSTIYYRCVADTPSLVECPDNLYFDASSATCMDYSMVAACQQTTATATSLETTTFIAPTISTQCDYAQLSACLLEFTDGLGFPSKGGIQIPPSSEFFLKISQFLQHFGTTGLQMLCIDTMTLLECPAAPNCFDETTFKGLGLSSSDFQDYYAFFARITVECAAVFGGTVLDRSYFSCQGRLNGTYMSRKTTCGRRFDVCRNGLAFRSRCPIGFTLEADGKDCVLVSGLAHCAGTPIAPESDEINLPNLLCPSHDAVYANPVMNCSMFYIRCHDGQPKIHTCPIGEVWDNVSGDCKTPGYVDVCSTLYDTTTIATTTTTTTMTTDLTTTTASAVPVPDEINLDMLTTVVPFDCTNLEDGDYADTALQCSVHYYSCSGEMAFARSCPGGLKWDPDHKVCDRSDYIAACGGVATEATTQSTGINQTTTPALMDCTDKPDGNYLHPEQPCHHLYVTCIGSVAFTRECPLGTRYDDKAQICNWPNYVPACGGTDNTTSSNSTPVVHFDCTGKGYGNYPNPDEKCSSTFFTCVGGTAYQRICAELTKYDAEMDQCDYPSFIPDCGGQRPTTPLASTTLAFTELNPTTEGVHYDCTDLSIGNHADPTKECSPIYFTCTGSKYGLRRECPVELWYDAELDLCSYHRDIPKCSGKPRKQPPTVPIVSTTKTQVAFNCRQPGNFPHPQNKCSQVFISCSANLHAQELTCPGNLYYDADTDECRKQTNVAACVSATTFTIIPTTIIPTTVIPTTLIPTTLIPTTVIPTTTFIPLTTSPLADQLEFLCPTSNGKFAPTGVNCPNYYWQCIDAKPIRTNCDFNYIFVEASAICQIKEYVAGCE